MDITSLLHSNGVGMESQAHNVFGAAVDDFTAQGMDLARASIVPPAPIIPFSGNWQSSQYASDLVRFAPKHRFMFRVKFSFTPGYAEAMINEGVDVSAFNYMVRQIDKPTVQYSYEDVNFYNFRTKVLKGIEHQQLTMTFYDDIQNNVLAFFDVYRKAHSPISRINTDFPSVASTPTGLQEQGMDFKDPTSGQAYSASIGPLMNNAINVLYKLEIYQIYGHGQFANVFTFLNPRIHQFDFDDMDHEGGANGNLLTVQFDYDALSVSRKNTRDAGLTSSVLPHEISVGTSQAPGAGGGILGAVANRALGGLINVATRNLGTATSGAIQRTLGPGSGYIGYSTGSIISDTSRYTLRGAQAGVVQPYAGSYQRPIIDNT